MSGYIPALNAVSTGKELLVHTEQEAHLRYCPGGQGGGNNIKKYNSLKRRVEFTAVMEKKVTLHPKFFLHQSVEQRNKTIFHSENVKCCLLKVTDVSQL